MVTGKNISAAFPFESRFVDVKRSKIHYVDEGDKGSEHTFLLLHGNPTSSYLWRNIIPHLTPIG
ncbi:MAG: haloalkane dehalogenase, partial [Bacteroidota bacterium]